VPPTGMPRSSVADHSVPSVEIETRYQLTQRTPLLGTGRH
jgi:hypothetical protein